VENHGQNHSPPVTKDLYSVMVSEEGTLDIRRAARGLHFAIRAVREEIKVRKGSRTTDPLIWAPYIHVGV
jgi:hypothetical protein